MIFVIATLRVHPDKLAKCLDAAKSCIAATRKEQGCISYTLNQNISDPHELVFVERWSDRDALAKHFQAPHLQDWRKVCAECLADRKVEIIEPAKVEVL